jgi:LacI family transcriptional regulator
MEGTAIRISDIALKAGVSSATVSRVINGTAFVEPATRRKVETALRALHYRPNLLARSLATRESHTLGLMIPHIRSPFFSGLATGVEERAEALGYAVFLCHTRESTECEARTLDLLARRRVDGIIATPVGHASGHFSDVLRSVPVVFAARHFSALPISSVVVDNAAASRRVVRHLLESGHRRIGVINGPQFLSTGVERWTGVRQAFRDHQMKPDPALTREGDFTAEAGYRLARGLLSRPPRPTALFAANHMTLVGCIRAVREAGLRIPEDVAVAGFEGFRDSGFEYLVAAPLTVNEHPTREMAVAAVDLLMEQIHMRRSGRRGAPTRLVLKTHLASDAFAPDLPGREREEATKTQTCSGGTAP